VRLGSCEVSKANPPGHRGWGGEVDDGVVNEAVWVKLELPGARPLGC